MNRERHAWAHPSWKFDYTFFTSREAAEVCKQSEVEKHPWTAAAWETDRWRRSYIPNRFWKHDPKLLTRCLDTQPSTGLYVAGGGSRQINRIETPLIAAPRKTDSWRKTIDQNRFQKQDRKKKVREESFTPSLFRLRRQLKGNKNKYINKSINQQNKEPGNHCPVNGRQLTEDNRLSQVPRGMIRNRSSGALIPPSILFSLLEATRQKMKLKMTKVQTADPS